MNNFPRNLSDSELANLAETLWTKVDAAPADYSATSVQSDDLKVKKNDFKTDLTAHTEAQIDARAKTKAKDLSRTALENVIRFLVKQARLNNISEALLTALGVPAEGQSAAASTATRPTGRVDTSQRLLHTIHFTDEAASENKRRPRGVLGCEIYQKIGGVEPVDDKECLFRGLDTKTPYTWEFDGEDVGKMAHYMLRWRFLDESTSPWSETISGTITG
jgi:hypothetical protein